MTAIFQDCKKTLVVSDRFMVLVITPMMSERICLRRAVRKASNLQDFKHMLYMILNTSASVMGSNYWKQE